MIQSFHSRAIFEAMSYNFPTIFWSLILHISLTRLGYFSSEKGKLKFLIQKCDGQRNQKILSFIITTTYYRVTFTPIAKYFMLYCRFIYMLSMLYVRLTIKVKLGIPEGFKVGWYPHKITGSSHFNSLD